MQGNSMQHWRRTGVARYLVFWGCRDAQPLSKQIEELEIDLIVRHDGGNTG